MQDRTMNQNYSSFQCAKALLALSLAVPLLGLAGQFDVIHQGFAQVDNTAIENWNKFFPGLESQINLAFEEGKRTGNFIFSSNKVPVAWNVTENGNIEVNSINAGYFKSLRNPEDYRLMFPGLTVESQNVSVSAGKDLIVTPVPIEEGGFGFALSVDADQKADLKAKDKIILMTPLGTDTSAYYDDLSIALSDSSSAQLSASQIFLFGGISAQYSSTLKLLGSSGIYFQPPLERNSSALSTIKLIGSKMDMDAPDIFIDRDVEVGVILFGTKHPSVLNIGQDHQSGVLTKNVYFTKKVDVNGSSQLNLTSEQIAVFQTPLNLIENSQATIRSRRIELEKLFLGNLGSHAKFVVDNEGFMLVHEPVAVGRSSQLTIDLGERSILSASINTHEGGSTRLSMRPNSYWFVPQNSQVSSVSLEPSSYIQLGKNDGSVKVETRNLSGSGGVFYLTAGAGGALNITESSEGKHSFLLGSTGSPLADTGYIYHIAVKDSSSSGQDQATFSLANGGIIDAGPYEYKLGLYPFKQGNSRVWAVLGAQTLKPTPPEAPDEPEEPPEENVPTPDLPDLPFDPENPPQFDSSVVKPIGLSPAAKLTLASTASGNQLVQYLGSLDDLRGRMGEIRSGGDDGLYVLYRYDKSRFHSEHSADSEFKYSAFSLGADHKLNANWILGGNIILTKGKIRVSDAPGNRSRVESAGAKFYAAWIGEKGQYIDTVLSLSRHTNKLSAKNIDDSVSTAKYRNYALGLSLEVGHRLEIPYKVDSGSWFIDPQMQLSYFRANGASFRFSNDMRVHVKAVDSLNGRVGFDFGKNFIDAEGKFSGQLYLRAGVNHDFLGKTSIQMNEFSFKDKSAGTRIYYGIGGEAVIKDRLKAFVQINRESGNRLKTDFQTKVGLKYLF